MDNILTVKEPRLPEFSNNYVADMLDFCLSSGIIDKENYEYIISDYLNEFNDFLISVIYRKNYIMIDEKDFEILFSNISYIVGFYVWHTKMTIDDFLYQVNRSTNLFKESEKYYFELLASLNERLNKIKDNNSIKIPALNYYFDKLIVTCKRYEDLSNETICDMPLGYKDYDNVNGTFEFFNLIPNNESNGFVNFIKLVCDVESQLEFYALFKPSRVKKVYDNLYFDVVPGSNIKPQKYTELLRPLLQQFLFCCEYSEEEAVHLTLKKDDVIFVFEDLKNRFLINLPKEKCYYKITPGDLIEIIDNVVEKYDISNYYKSRLERYFIELFFFDKKTFGDEIKVAYKDTIDKKICEFKGKPMYAKCPKPADEVISKITEQETKILESVTEIDISYVSYLQKALESNDNFKKLSDTTKEYIITNIPDVRNSLMSLLTNKKNTAFYVED